jgi:hypothetical protein
MDLVPKAFHAIPMHMNPPDEDHRSDNPTAAAPPPSSSPPSSSSSEWHCNLLFLSSAADPASIFAISVEDPLIDRHLFCTSLGVSVKEVLEFDDHGSAANGLALHHERPYAMLQRQQQNKSIGKFLYGLSHAVSPEHPLKAFMLADDGDEVTNGDEEPDDDAILTLVMHFDVDAVLSPLARAAGIISGREEIEHVNLRFEFSRTARAAHVASLALMMASHPRLGGESPVGRVLGTDMLRLVCDAYRLRLHECRRCVWSA